MRRAGAVISLLLILLGVAEAPRVALGQRQTVGPQTVYFPASGHHLDNRYGFLDYWRANGQLLRFGYPITEVIEEDGRPVQYFERARMEYHAENAGTPHSVLLGLLGRELVGQNQYPVGAPAPGRLFRETGYTVFGKFLQYWTKRGGLPVFGYPISESYVEPQPDGSQLAVQWFERARLEYHPDTVHPFYKERERANGVRIFTLYEILMGQLGREIALRHGLSLAPVPRAPRVPDWSPALWPQRIVVDLSDQQLTAYEGDMAVFRAGVSTGKDGFNTPPGNYAVYAKLLYDDMTGNLRGEEYDVRKVPYVLYFHLGYAIHGTYWHNLFGSGTRISHGCVNLSMDDADWLWQWAQPVWIADRAQRARGYQALEPKSSAEAELQPLEGLAIFRRGTPVIVQE
jgi:hypothetical protein